MRLPVGKHRFDICRRGLLAGCTASVLTARSLRADGLPVVKVGLLPFGTVQWVIETLKLNEFDKANGIRIESVPLASTEAGRVAFLSGSVDTIVQDILFAARLKAEKQPVHFLPQSSTEGELVVPAASPIRGLADLKDKKIGIAGGAIDKNWLFLRAAALEQAKLDLTKERARFSVRRRFSRRSWKAANSIAACCIGASRRDFRPRGIAASPRRRRS